MKINATMGALLLEELAKTGLEVKPFKEHPERGVSASAQCVLESPVELTVNGETAQYIPRINVNVNFFKAREPKAAAVGINTLPAQLKRVGELVEKLKA